VSTNAENTVEISLVIAEIFSGICRLLRLIQKALLLPSLSLAGATVTGLILIRIAQDAYIKNEVRKKKDGHKHT